MTNRLSEHRLGLLMQLARFGASGGALTAGSAGSYWIAVQLLHIDPPLAMGLVYLLFTGIGYLVHSRYSFRGHGSRDQIQLRTARFVGTNAIGLIINQFFVWLLIAVMHGSKWWPVIPMIFVVPPITFLLNRFWVFR